MNIQGFSSIKIQPANPDQPPDTNTIGLAFSYSNIILDTATTPTSTQYFIPSASDLLQRFGGLDYKVDEKTKPSSICKTGDVWSKRFIMTRNEAVTILPVDKSGVGSVTITGVPSGGLKVVNVYLLWLDVTFTDGDATTLDGRYHVLSDQSAAVTALTSAIVEDSGMVNGSVPLVKTSSTDSKTSSTDSKTK